MIVKKDDGYYVVSKSGRNMGGPYEERDSALKRLRAVEYYKHKTAGPEVLQSPSKYSLQEIFAELKFGRPAESQKYLQKQIDYLNKQAEQYLDKLALSSDKVTELMKILPTKRLNLLKDYTSKITNPETALKIVKETERTKQQLNMLGQYADRAVGRETIKKVGPWVHFLPDQMITEDVKPFLDLAKSKLKFYDPNQFPKLKYRKKK